MPSRRVIGNGKSVYQNFREGSTSDSFPFALLTWQSAYALCSGRATETVLVTDCHCLSIASAWAEPCRNQREGDWRLSSHTLTWLRRLAALPGLSGLASTY